MTSTKTPNETVKVPTVAASRWRVPGALGGQRRLYGLVEHLLLAALAYVPVLAVRRGIVTSDTKTYLYLDPGRFLHQVATMWNPSVALGTVTHEYVGYLLPMGPFYWFFSVLGAPVWVAQRLWLGSILFVAGTGTLYLCRTLHLRAPGRTVAGLAFMLSPYVLQYAGRISVILLPWAGLPIMVALTARALRHGGWRYPALFALVVALTSGINASSIIYVGVAPVLWLVFAVVAEREATWRQAVVAAGKIGLLTLLCSLWWIVGLGVEAGYGVNVLRYTETLPATSRTSSASEVLRGLGYWYFYGADRLGPWAQSSVLYTQRLWLLAASYLVPVLAFVSAVVIRWRARAYFVFLVLVGVVLSVGAYPYKSPTPVGGVIKLFMSQTTAGLALRSTDRATPLVVLGLAMLLGAGVSAIRVRLPVVSAAAAVAAAAAIVAANPALFTGDAEVASFFTQPAKLPAYQLAAISYLNATHPGTRVLAIPGNDFASYRWGDTVDTPQPALLDRPFVTREQQVMGSIATANTLSAIDDPMQLGTEQWQALAPMASLLSAGDVLVQYDQRFEHYGVPHPRVLAGQLAQTPTGLSDPKGFGAPRPNVPSFRTLDGQDLATTNNGSRTPPAPLVDYSVAYPRPITRAESDAGATIVSGDASGLEDLAGLGALDTNGAIYYSAGLDRNPSQLRQLLARGAGLVVTDTNRKRAFRWDTLTANYGFTETPSENLTSSDPSDYPVDLFPGAPLDTNTTASYTGAAQVTASSYGSSVSYTPENRAYSAIDGNLDTSWNTGTFVPDPAGQWWQAHFGNPVTADHVTLVQPQIGEQPRWITRATLTFDGRHALSVRLGPSSHTSGGQVVSFPARSFRTLRITIDATTNDHMPAQSATGVGFAEVEIPGVHVTEVMQMPRDLLAAAGPSSDGNRLTMVMSRERVSPYQFPVRTDPETTISRAFSLPTTRTFSVTGTASLNSLIPDNQIDSLVGRPGSDGSGVVAYSKGRLPGDLQAGAAAAVDGNPATAWQPGFGAGHQKGDWLEFDTPRSVSFDHLALQVVADGRHSVPTALQIATENGTRSVTLPRIVDRHTPGATVSVPVSFPEITGRNIRVTVTGVRFEKSTNYYSPKPIALPLGIAEMGIPGVQVAPVPANLPGNCRSGLVSVDGKPLDVRVVGSTSAALDNGEVSIVPCGPSAAGITLGPGEHVVQTALGHSPSTGWNVDQLAFDSAPGGAAAPVSAPGTIAPTPAGPAPTATPVHRSPTSEALHVNGANAPFELVLGQSSNPGWRAVATPAPGAPKSARTVDLGRPQLVDGFANGWQVTSSDLQALGAAQSGSFHVSLDWTPQRWVWTAFAVSAAAIALCVALALVPVRRRFTRSFRRRRRRRRALEVPSGERATARPALDGAPSPPREPELSSPFRGPGERPALWVVAVLSIATGAVAGAVTSLPVGAVAAVATAAALLVRSLRTPVTLAAVGLVVAVGVSVVTGQALHAVPESSDWPSAYDTAGLLAWFAVVALGVDAVVTTARDRRAARASPPDA